MRTHYQTIAQIPHSCVNSWIKSRALALCCHHHDLSLRPIMVKFNNCSAGKNRTANNSNEIARENKKHAINVWQ